MSNRDRLVRARTVLGRSQADVAAASGVSQPNIAAFESGTRPLTDTMLTRLLEAMDARPSVLLRARRDAVVETAGRFGATDLRLFGSSARGEDTVHSDIDLLACWPHDVSLYDYAEAEEALEQILGVGVDIIDDRGLTRRHERIVRDAVPV